MIEHWLRQFDPRDLILIAFFVGMSFSDRRVRRSLRSHGERLGAQALRLMQVETKVGVTPPREGSNGE